MATDYPQISNISVKFIETNNSVVDYALYGYTRPTVYAFVTAHPDYPIKKWRLTGGGMDISGDYTPLNGDDNYNFLATGAAFRTWGNVKLTLTVEDERGETASITSDEFYIQEYNRPLVNNFSASRFIETEKVNGNDIKKYYIRVNASATSSPIKNGEGTDINTLSCTVSYKKSTDSNYSNFVDITNVEFYTFEVNKDSNYIIKLKVNDNYLETVAYYNVFGDSKDFNIADGGGGVAIGDAAQKGYFDVAYNSRFQKEVSSKAGFVSTGTGSKGDFLYFGEATRIVTMKHTVHDEETGSDYIVVDSWGDFNDCTEIGLYCVWWDNDVKESNYYKVLNAPCELAGTLRVFYANGTAGESSSERYIMQEYVVYDGRAVYRRNGKAGAFNRWYKYEGTSVD